MNPGALVWRNGVDGTAIAGLGSPKEHRFEGQSEAVLSRGFSWAQVRFRTILWQCQVGK